MVLYGHGLHVTVWCVVRVVLYVRYIIEHVCCCVVVVLYCIVYHCMILCCAVLCDGGVCV